MNALVVGGTSGLGLELAKLLKANHDHVIITGRTNPKQSGLDFREVPLSLNAGSARLNWIVDDNPRFDMVVYNPGFYQEGHISDLTSDQILEMVNVGFLAAVLLMQRVMKKQDYLPCFVAVTSTSQFIPREFEPVYTAVKAALGMFANSLSLDPRIGKILVAAPAGMKTNFWAGTDKDTSGMLDPAWVAEQIIKLLEEDFKYKYARILRGPARVEIVEVR